MQGKKFLISVCCSVLLFLAGCGEVGLYEDLTEEDANQIMVLLSENNVRATKKKEVRQNEISYAVLVPRNEMLRARELLVQHHLPRRKELGLTGVYKEKGLIPTPDEQKARFLLAIKGEIINSLERIPEVLDADVILNIPAQDEFASELTKQRKRPTASVVVRAMPTLGAEAAVTEAKIQQFVANSVEDLHPRDVTVIISYLTPGSAISQKPGDVVSLSPRDELHLPRHMKLKTDEELLGLSLDASSKSRLKVYFLIFFLVLVLLSAFLIVAIVSGSRLRKEVSKLKAQGGESEAIEGNILGESRQLGTGEPPLE